MYEGDKRLGDFAIVREIGRGGMGIVYEAKQISLARQVALKVLSSSLGLTPKAVQRFRREAEAAAKLHHTNIVPVYAIGEEDGTHFYAMELIEGPSLDPVIRQLRENSRNPTPDSTAPAQGEPVSPDLVQTSAYDEGARATSTTAGLSSSSLGSGSGYFDTVARMIAEVTDAGIPLLQQLPSLRHLVLGQGSRPMLTDRATVELGSLHNLKVLEIRGWATPEAIDGLVEWAQPCACDLLGISRWGPPSGTYSERVQGEVVRFK